jgi:hypothetical protein
VKSAETAVARQLLYNLIYKATSSRYHGLAYTQQKNTSRHVISASVMTSCDNKGIVGSGVFCWARAEMYLENRNIRKAVSLEGICRQVGGQASPSVRLL